MKYYLIGLLSCLTLSTLVYAQDEVASTMAPSEVSTSITGSDEKLTKADKIQQNFAKLKQRIAERKAKLEDRSMGIEIKKETIKSTIYSKNISEEKKKEITTKIDTKAQTTSDRVDEKISKVEQKEIKITSVGQAVIDGDYATFQSLATPKMLQMINTQAIFDKLVTAYRVLVSTQASKNNDKASIKPSSENKPLVPATTDSQSKPNKSQSSTSSDNDKTIKSTSTPAAESNDLPSQNTKIYTPAELAQAAQVERSDGPVEMKKVQTKRGYWIMVPVE